jgi:hypothetical protein
MTFVRQSRASEQLFHRARTAASAGTASSAFRIASDEIAPLGLVEASCKGALSLSNMSNTVDLVRKVRRHLLPLLFLLYVVAYLDRINVGFAALNMNRELGLSSEQYGLLSGIFFCGYFLFEIPSNLILHRVGARSWIARILLTWGLVAVLTGFVQNASQLYIARFLLGVAEAGFFPGILYYLSYWFRQRQQAQAIGFFLTALPTASILGGPLSGWILDHVHGFGLSSWRWLLILEALPAIACGLLTYRLLPDRPADASFLTAEEKVQIQDVLAAEAAAKPRRGAAYRTQIDYPSSHSASYGDSLSVSHGSLYHGLLDASVDQGGRDRLFEHDHRCSRDGPERCQLNYDDHCVAEFGPAK